MSVPHTKASSRKIIVAMSGGVDSSVTAALLHDQGHDVVGVTMSLLPQCDASFGCCGSPDDLAIAKRAAEKIGIPHYVLDFSPDFGKDVIDYFIHSYLKGETPNPCIACNRHIKFDKLDKFARSLKADCLSTGHYARIIERTDTGKSAEGQKQFHLFEAVDKTKDQSYVLYHFDQASLHHTCFPLGDLKKVDVRAIAKKYGLPNSDKKDSQEICFVPDKDYAAFVMKTLKSRGAPLPPTTQPGAIEDSSGKKLGLHKGISFYTIGQRKGLGLTVPEPYYVIGMNPKTNTLVVGPDSEGASENLEAHDVHWVLGQPPAREFTADVKIRYKHEPAKARIYVQKQKVQVQFEVPQRAVTPGQSAVFYRWDETMQAREVIGGGKIVSGDQS